MFQPKQATGGSHPCPFSTEIGQHKKSLFSTFISPSYLRTLSQNRNLQQHLSCCGSADTFTVLSSRYPSDMGSKISRVAGRFPGRKSSSEDSEVDSTEHHESGCTCGIDPGSIEYYKYVIAAAILNHRLHSIAWSLASTETLLARLRVLPG